MTDDTRNSDRPETKATELPKEQQQQQQQQDSTPPQSKKPDTSKSQLGKLWDAFGSPEEPANVLPEAKYANAAELKRKHDQQNSFQEILASGNGIGDLKTVHKTPCARDAFMLGIASGFGIGGVRGIWGGLRAIWPACSWAVYTFAIASFASFEFCRKRRLEELDGMNQAVEMMRQIHLKKQREKEQKAVKEEASRIEEERQKSWTNPSNYKFW